MRQITLNRQLLGLEDLLFGTGTVTQNRANQVVTITEINAGNLPFDETRTLVEFAQDTNLEELGNSVEAINNLNNNLDKLLIVEDNLPIINNVEAIKESIVTLDTNILALQNIDTNMFSINTVEDNLPEVVSVAQNIVPNLTEILNVDTLAAQVTQDKSDVSSMKLVVETIYDTFDDRFLGTNIVDPTLDNDGNALIDGAMYFNTSSNTMKVYDVGTTTWYSIPQIYLSALLDVQLTSITSGNVLRWNGTKWINYTLSKSDVELNLVDNTADSAKNVLSATKLTTARTINGVSFDGMANITISDSTAVKLTGDQTIAGVKTFNSSPVVPNPTVSTQAMNLGTYNNGLGKQGYTHTANATFTGADNKIVMTGIVTALGLEVGDVITFNNANAANNKPHTVESITNDNTIIVNYEHCGNRGNGSLKLFDQTVTSANCKLLAKWFIAREGLGQDWVQLSSLRTAGATNTNNTNRGIEVSVESVAPSASSFALAIILVNGERLQNNAAVWHSQSNQALPVSVSLIISSGSNYTTFFNSNMGEKR